MLKLVSKNDIPTVCAFRMRRNATSTIEAEEIFAENTEGRVISVDTNRMPFTEIISEIPEQEQPVFKKYRAGNAFRLAVYNFSANSEVPLVGFSIEQVKESNDIYLSGSKNIIDPSKSGLTKSAVAIIPLLHVFHSEIHREAKRAGNLIDKTAGNKNIASFADALDKRMMKDALTATQNVINALYGNKVLEPVEQPKMGVDCLSDKLQTTLDASESFYDALMNKARDIYEPSIRTLAEKVALNRLNYH